MDNSYQNRKIVKSLAEGSYSAFEELYFLYNEKLYHFIMRLSSGNTYMAEEVVQLTFIRVWEIHEKIDPNESFISFITSYESTVWNVQRLLLYLNYMIIFIQIYE